MADARKNFATSTVATAPSPATSGTSLVVAAGEGARFATPPFNAVICPSDAEPTPLNAEIVRVTDVSTDTLTITRAQESSTARSVVVGDAIYAGVTKKTLDDMDATAFPGYPPSYFTGEYYPAFLGTTSGAGSGVPVLNRAFYQPFIITKASQAFDRIATYITVNGTATTVFRMGVYLDNGAGKPGTLVFDAGTVATDAGAAAIKAITIAQTLAAGHYWSCIVGQVATPATTQRVLPLVGNYLGSGFTGSALIAETITGALASNPTLAAPANLNPPIVALRAA